MRYVVEHEDGVVVTVVYGTSQKLDRLYKGKFAITKQGHPAVYASARLSFDATFDLGQSVDLPWAEDFSRCRRTLRMGSSRRWAVSTHR